MSARLQELISLLTLERLEENLFRGPSKDIGTNRVYGGQVLGQAIKAAQYTVVDRNIHSLHAYFLRQGDHNAPIIYEVDRSRDGGSFSARRVVAIQHGRPIFTLSASFQISESGLDYQPGMPEVPKPDDSPDVKIHESQNLPEKLRRLLQLSAPFHIRSATARPESQTASPAMTRFWVKTVAALPDEPDLHRAMLAYVSDCALLPSTLVPHGIDLFKAKMQMASIDHAMWFHRPFKMDTWLLYCCEAVSTSNSRGLAKGSFYKEDGSLVASSTQEGAVPGPRHRRKLLA